MFASYARNGQARYDGTPLLKPRKDEGNTSLHPNIPIRRHLCLYFGAVFSSTVAAPFSVPFAPLWIAFFVVFLVVLAVDFAAFFVPSPTAFVVLFTPSCTDANPAEPATNAPAISTFNRRFIIAPFFHSTPDQQSLPGRVEQTMEFITR